MQGVSINDANVALQQQYRIESNMLVSLKVSRTYLEGRSGAAIWGALCSWACWGAPFLCIATKPCKRSNQHISSQQVASCCSSAGFLASGSRRKKRGASPLKAEGNQVLCLKTMLDCCAGRGRGKPYRLRDCSQGICNFFGFLHRDLGDHGAQGEDNNAVFSRGIHNSFQFLPTQSTSLVKVLFMSDAVGSITFPQNCQERQENKQSTQQNADREN